MLFNNIVITASGSSHFIRGVTLFVYNLRFSIFSTVIFGAVLSITNFIVSVVVLPAGSVAVTTKV